MAGYSATPLIRKLGIKGGASLYFRNPPSGFTRTLGALPDGADVAGEVRPGLDFILLFAGDKSDLDGAFAGLAAAIKPDGMLWVAWPKKASGVPTDLSFEIVQRIGLDGGLVDVKVCAIDETWSGLKFMVRKEDRALRR